MRSDLDVWRNGQFQFKQIVSDLLTEVISGAIDRAEEYIHKTELVTFNYGELQMHSVLIPSIVEQVDSFILEYPIVRKRGRLITLEDRIIIADVMSDNEMSISCLLS